MAANQKDTIYIDVDDEITSIIDKVQASPQKIVALVLPKRAAVLQSVVNMKLLKRTADNGKKHLVLITSDNSLLPLAGAVGLYVASSLQSKPAIPPAPDGTAAAAADAAGDIDDFDTGAASGTPVGQLAAPAAFAPADDELETIQLDDDEPADGADAAGTASVAVGAGGLGAAATAPKPKKNSKLKVPNFDRFRMLLVLGGLGLVALVVLGYVAAAVLPKATVTLTTDSSDVPTNETVTLDPTQTELDVDNKILPAKIASKQQASNQQVATSGQKNNGQKATGSVVMTAGPCTSTFPDDVPAGTGVSANGLTYITDTNTTFVATLSAGKKCVFSANQATGITAQKAGANYNINASSFTVAGRSDVTASTNDQPSGGTDNIVKVVAQSDIDSAKQKLTSSDSSSVKSALASQLSGLGYTAVASSLHAGDPTVTSSAQVGDPADTVTVTSTTNYTMYGYKQDDLKNLILANVKDKIDPSKQKILNDGTDKASFSINSPVSSGALQADLSASTLAGPDIKTDVLKAQIAGKKTNDVRTAATATPGVTDVKVKYSPFWVSTVPKNQSKITIVIEKAAATSNANQP